MKKLITILLAVCGLNSFGQLIIYGGQTCLTRDTADHFTIDTLKVSGDTTFMLVKHIFNGHLLHQEEQIEMQSKVTCRDCKEENKYKMDGYRTFWHGHSIQWYPNGQKKCEGTFKMGEKLNDWKYWNEDGKEIPAPKNNHEIRVRGSRTNRKQ